MEPAAAKLIGAGIACIGMGGAGVGVGIIGGWAPLAFIVVFTGLELLIAFLQAYVFAILTCLYLNDAIHLHH